MNDPTAPCRCGVEHIIRPGTKVFCTGCGMAFHAFEARDQGFRYDLRAEDMRDKAFRRRPEEVVAEAKERAEEMAAEGEG